MYNTVFWDFSKHCVAKTSPRSALPKDLITKVDKDTNFTILTNEIYRKVNELKAENWWVQKNKRNWKHKNEKIKVPRPGSDTRPEDGKTTSPGIAAHWATEFDWIFLSFFFYI